MINVNLIYPIGAVYISINSTNPSNIFGGSWERIKGKMLIGVDEADTDFKQSGLSGGEKEHTLTIDESAPHSHILGTSTQNPSGSYDIAVNAKGFSNNLNVSTSSTGGGQPHNNMPPYYTVYIFVRTA